MSTDERNLYVEAGRSLRISAKILDSMAAMIEPLLQELLLKHQAGTTVIELRDVFAEAKRFAAQQRSLAVEADAFALRGRGN